MNSHTLITQDPETAADAGWEIDNVLDAINNMKPESLRTRLVGERTSV